MSENPPAGWPADEENDTRVRTLRMLDELAAKVSSIAHGLNVYRENRIEDARYASILAGKISGNLAVLDVLGEVRKHDAIAVPASPGTLAAGEPKLCIHCGISGRGDAPLMQIAGVTDQWQCTDSMSCLRRHNANRGLVVPKAVADARESRAWDAGYQVAMDTMDMKLR